MVGLVGMIQDEKIGSMKPEIGCIIRNESVKEERNLWYTPIYIPI